MSDHGQPLHVRVARALGWIYCQRRGFHGEWLGCPPTPGGRWGPGWGPDREIPAYDTDWAATGPSIKEHRISLTLGECTRHQECSDLYCATNPDHRKDDCVDHEPLVAVCNLLVALRPGLGAPGP